MDSPEDFMERVGYERILVPTDLSDFANRSLRYAAMFRDRLGSAVTVMYADEVVMPFDLLEAPIAYYLQRTPETRETLRTRLAAHAQEQIGGTFETKIVEGPPKEAILEAAQLSRADLIIMGTHGRTGIRRALLGSVAENVVHHAPIPVLTIRNGSAAAFRRILCPVNFTEAARTALEHAAMLAEQFGAELDVTYVVEQGQPEDVETMFQQWIEPELRARTKFNHIVLRDGNPAERVLALAASSAADLIVIGAQHRRFSDATVIGSTTERITRFARVPVLTVARKADRA
jgi:nucleotide-binding universal stress UspA family protein